MIDGRLNQEFKQREAGTFRQLRAAGSDTLLLYANGHSLGTATRSHGYARYLTGWNSANQPAAIIMQQSRRPVVYVPNIFMKFLADEYYDNLDVRFVPPTCFGTTVGQHINDLVGKGGKVGYIGRNESTFAFERQLTGECTSVEFFDFERSVDALRTIKSEYEICQHRAAAELCDRLFALAFAEARSGKAAFQIQADLQREALYSGADFCTTWITAGPVADYSRFLPVECRRIPQDNDQYVVGIMLLYQGHWGHAIRMGNLGAPNRAQSDAFDTVTAIHDAMFAHIRAGAPIRDLQEVAEDVLTTRAPAGHKIFKFRFAHPLGHSYADPLPDGIQPFPQQYEQGPVYTGDFRLKPGMLLEIHPNFFAHDYAGAAIGDMVLVTDDGLEPLTAYPRQLLLL